MLKKDQLKVLRHRKKVLEDVERTILLLDRIGHEPIISQDIELEGRKITFLSIFYLLAFGAVEFVTYFVAVSSGILLEFTLLLTLIISPSIVKAKAHREFLFALGLIPLMRIVSLVVPVAEISEIYWYIIIAIPIF